MWLNVWKGLKGANYVSFARNYTLVFRNEIHSQGADFVSFVRDSACVFTSFGSLGKKFPTVHNKFIGRSLLKPTVVREKRGTSRIRESAERSVRCGT